MSFWAAQGTFFIKPLLSRTRGIADLSNIKEETQKLRKNDKAEEIYSKQKNRMRQQKKD